MNAPRTNAPTKFAQERLMTVLLAPIISEKATMLADKHEQVVFRVAQDATKPEVKAAVELMFKVQVDSVQISNVRGNHPNGVFAYRIEYDGHAVMYATDTEHYSVVDPKLRRLARNADVLIYDAMYLPEEYTGEAGGMPKTGWGHSTYEHGVLLAREAGVKRLVLFHHDPAQNDADVAEKERRARAIFPACEAAREGLVIDL